MRGHRRQAPPPRRRGAARPDRPAVGALAALVTAVALLAAGCGGSDDASPQEQWAADVCGALSDWESSVSSIATDFSGGVSKDVLSQKVDDAEQATSDLVDELKSIGPPETEAGDQAKSEIDAFADTASTSVASIKSEADSLQGSGVAGFTAGVASITAELNTVVQSAKTTLANVEQLDATGQLKTAIENDPTCQSLSSGS
jgi:hypothetical protein